MKITSLTTLIGLLNKVPEGTTADVLASDLEAGNFETAHLVSPDGAVLEVVYSGEIAKGYVNPFES